MADKTSENFAAVHEDGLPRGYEAKIRRIARRDARYAYEAYLFVFDSLEYTQRMVIQTRRPQGPIFHVSGRELLEGIRRLAAKQFGLMAKTVFENWGVRCTEDFGRIVFKLVDGNLMRKTESDTIEDFKDIYDFAVAFDGEAQQRRAWHLPE